MVTPAPILPPVMFTAPGSWTAMPRRFLTPGTPSVAPFQHSATLAISVRNVAEIRFTGKPPCGAPSGGGEELLAGSRLNPSAYAIFTSSPRQCYIMGAPHGGDVA